MSNNNYILDLLNIKDQNIFIYSDKIETTKNNKGITRKIVRGILTYKPTHCSICGCINESSNDIIKWGFRKNCMIKIPKISNCNSILILDKQRFRCKHCNETFIAETSLVNKNKNISNNTDLYIKTELMTKSSQTDIAKRADVSTSSVEEVLKNISKKTVLRHACLPKEMNWDEFKATKDTKGKMAFMIMDNHKGTIFDILDSRKTKDLELYFSRYSRKERNKVKLISTDFYSGYIHIAKRFFKNADIVIDRFHIVTQIYNALQSSRIVLCYKSNPNYNKLKHFWKLIVKSEDELSEEKKYSKHFRKEVSQKEIVSYLINTDKQFKVNYEYYQGIIKSIKNRDFDTFKSIVSHPNKDLSEKMKKAITLFNKYIKYIENSFEYDINNGIIEGTINLIKCIKRISFGYRKFSHFSTRILLIKGIIKG